MTTHTYGKHDYAFGQAMLTLRTEIGLTQAGLAQVLGVSRGTVLGWEAGRSYPKAKHLKCFIAFGVKQRAFPAGREEEEIRALWQAAHQKVVLAELWLSALLGQRPPEPTEGTGASTLSVAQPAPGRRVEWEAVDVPSFYGRETELATLEQWVMQEHCRVVSVLGMGGIGKSALVVSLMHQVAQRFEVVIWRSLRDAPPAKRYWKTACRCLLPSRSPTCQPASTDA